MKRRTGLIDVKKILQRIIHRLTPRIILRRNLALSYYKPQLQLIRKWQVLKSESSNFYYDLDEKNKCDLASLISYLTNTSYYQIMKYFQELEGNRELITHIENQWSQDSSMRNSKVGFGRRLGWYAFARVLKPRIVVETGVHQGFGSLVLTSALIENSKEGFIGKYIGTDIDKNAGILFRPPYSNFGKILYGDSLESLKKFSDGIDLFINDSDHSPIYESFEYQLVRDRLSPNAFLLGDNSHVSNSLRNFSIDNGRNFVFFKEIPKNHWYPGAGIGISF